MYCENCGKQISATAKFCIHCGARQEDVQEPLFKDVPSKADEIENDNASPLTSFFFEEVPEGYQGDEARELPEQVKKVMLVSLIGVFIATLVIGLIWTFSDDIFMHLDMREAYSLAKEVVEDELLYPPSAKFPKYKSEYVVYSGLDYYKGNDYQMFIVTSYVDSSNMLGGMARFKYQVIIGLPVDSDAEQFYREIVYME